MRSEDQRDSTQSDKTQNNNDSQAVVVDAVNSEQALLVSRESEALIAACQAGDLRAFQTLYETHKGRVYAVVYRLAGDPDEAMDITQEVFVQVWRKLDSFRGESAFSTWLHRVATNIAISQLRKRKQWWRRLVSDSEGLAEEPSVPLAVRDTRLEQAIQSLPEQARKVFVLFGIEGYQHDEIADMLGIAVGSSKAQFFRARKLLKEKLDDQQH